ncbi:uncharacterized protein LOC141683605 [Apium graveolens]|uniref:uncharacterized protein LOC141683605 n=1 Tax=Apium graveolens TaxID=4045 RepID=UPI003D79C144
MYLRYLSNQKPSDWVNWLPLAELLYNTTYQSAIKMTRYKALYGRDPPSFNYHQAQKTNIASVDQFMSQRTEIQQLLKINLSLAQERMVLYANNKRSERHFKEGDYVLLKVQAFRQLSLKNTKDNKFSARYYGPYKVLKKKQA